MRRVLINAGGKVFETTLKTLSRFPNTKFAQLFSHLPAEQEPHLGAGTACGTGTDPLLGGGGCSLHTSGSPSQEIFLDVCPRVFERVLNFLRTQRLVLPVNDLSFRGDLIHQLDEWELLPCAFSSTQGGDAVGEEEEGEGEGDGESPPLPLPDVCVVQLLDTMSLEAGVRRHALTVTFGADGFQLRPLTIAIRRDLRHQLSSTYWQVHQTGERSLFFATTRVADGAAALLTTSVQQQVVTHTEGLGYTLVSSTVTISPDPVHASVRLFLQQLIFRRARISALEHADVVGLIDVERGDGDEEETFLNFEDRHVGPKRRLSPDNAELVPPDEERSRDIWETTNNK